MKKITFLILTAGFFSLLSCITDDEGYSPDAKTDNFENIVYSKDGDEEKDSTEISPFNPNAGDPPPKETGGNGHKAGEDGN